MIKVTTLNEMEIRRIKQNI